MRRAILLAAAVVTLSACGSPRYVFRVDRTILHGSVQKHIRHSLEEVAGVKEIAFDTGSSTIIVKHDGTVKAKAVGAAIRRSGLWTGEVTTTGENTWSAYVIAQMY